MKKKNLKSKLSLKVKDVSTLSEKETKQLKGGQDSTWDCDPCWTRSCPAGGYSCGQFQCVSM